MSQIALHLVLLNLWAVLVWAAAMGAARAARPVAGWSGFWLAALALVLAPWALSGALGPARDAAAPLLPAASPAAVAPAPFAALPELTLAETAPGTVRAEAFSAPVAAAAAAPPPAMTQAAADIWGRAVSAVAAPVAQWALGAAAGLYLLVAAGMAARGLAGGLRLRAMARRGRRIAPPGAPASVPTIAVDAPAPPLALGLPRPCILIPETLLRRTGEAELAMILRHEAAHIRRRDPESATLTGLVSALFWINPAVRDLVRRWRLAAEIQADAAAAGQAPRDQRTAYARLLVSALRARGAEAPAAPAAVLRLDHKGSVKMRLSAILDGAGPEVPRRARLAAGAALLSVGAAGLAGFGALAQTTDAAPARAGAAEGAPERLTGPGWTPGAEGRGAYEREQEFDGEPADGLEREVQLAQAGAERRQEELEAAAERRERALERAEAEREAAEDRREAELEAAAERREAAMERAAGEREAAMERRAAEMELAAERHEAEMEQFEARMEAAGEAMGACGEMMGEALGEEGEHAQFSAAIECFRTRAAEMGEIGVRFGPALAEFGGDMAEFNRWVTRSGADVRLPAREVAPEDRARIQAELAEAEQRVRQAQADLRDAHRELAALGGRRVRMMAVPAPAAPAARPVEPASPPGVPPARITSGLPDRELEGGPEE